MTFNFDAIIDRSSSDSNKWTEYDDTVLPMWVADMDFRAPEPVLETLHARIDHGVFGYGYLAPRCHEIICERMARLYNWHVTPEQVVFMPGVVSGLNIACRMINEPGNGVLVQPPVYPPFLSAPENQGMVAQHAPLLETMRDGHLYYEIDFDAFEAAITPQTRLFMLCSPHNPVGRQFTRDELTRLAEICVRHDLLICSDEIHCELLLSGRDHIPTATLAPEIAERCVTLLAPSKTFNIPGLGFSFAIVQDNALRARVLETMKGIAGHPSILGIAAAEVAYTQCDDWHEAMLAYLTANRDYVVDFVDMQLPGIRTTIPEATYLAWLDCRDAGLVDQPFEFFLEAAKVAMNPGPAFGDGGDGFVRLNFGCPRDTLVDGLQRIKFALASISIPA